MNCGREKRLKCVMNKCNEETLTLYSWYLFWVVDGLCPQELVKVLIRPFFHEFVMICLCVSHWAVIRNKSKQIRLHTNITLTSRSLQGWHQGCRSWSRHLSGPLLCWRHPLPAYFLNSIVVFFMLQVLIRCLLHWEDSKQCGWSVWLKINIPLVSCVHTYPGILTWRSVCL